MTHHKNNQALIQYLASFVSDNRQDRITEVLVNRTRFLTVVLEDLFQPHNASAVLRSCDCFGIQDIHIIEKANRYRVNPDIALGSTQWLSRYKYDNTKACYDHLKSKGYRIAAMTLDDESISLEEVNLNQKTALCFGTEETGLTDTAIDLADIKIKIPMFGFTQSFNISVSAAISLYALTLKLHQSKYDWQLSDAEKETLKIEWLVNSIPGGEKIKTAFLKNL